MKTVFLIVIILIVAWIVISAGRRRKMQEALFYEIKEDDVQMKHATALAIRTLPEFEKAVSAPTPKQEGFSIKARFEGGEQTEHIWLETLKFDEHGITGVLGNDSYVANIGSAGTETTISKEDVTDWMYIDDGKLKGGYTIKLNWQRQPSWIKKRMQAMLPFQIEDRDS